VRRIRLTPREDHRRTVLELGLIYGFSDERPEPYWNEGAAYVFSEAEIARIEKALKELVEIGFETLEHLTKEQNFEAFGLPREAARLITESWEADDPTLYGRMDIMLDKRGTPRLVEYNADTPTMLLETAVVQWQWLEERFPDKDQFNSLHEALIQQWSYIRTRVKGDVLHLAYEGEDTDEDMVTVTYLRDSAREAGFFTVMLRMSDVGWDGREFVDLRNESIRSVFKLYPWEWMLTEKFGAHVLNLGRSNPVWIEPPWKALLSSKAILPIMWRLFGSKCPYLVETRFETCDDRLWVRKPRWSREGANIRIGDRYETDGPYRDAGYVFQEFVDSDRFDGLSPVLGCWVVGQDAVGLGIRESFLPVTDDQASFVPHFIE
jgi:glutathionylspermidine synthase